MDEDDRVAAHTLLHIGAAIHANQQDIERVAQTRREGGGGLTCNRSRAARIGLLDRMERASDPGEDRGDDNKYNDDQDRCEAEQTRPAAPALLIGLRGGGGAVLTGGDPITGTARAMGNRVTVHKYA